ncbi:hypothetical protein RDWZM_000490 [Blomia tropicalis]|uniref:Uncharacterized protein n=1 Tax=Blomia tropicalis TaxID=40697 RepID=A0A9Q0MDV8_BLOTA|nr:hypothetical protein BLOT_013853 [Blomia tropicalis]KAJ6221945.1 hypothetical protein RDWZM_000490 [Blomia tropicalis]
MIRIYQIVCLLAISGIVKNRAVEKTDSHPHALDPSIECRPDEAFVEGQCVRLRKSMSELVQEILENSDGTSSFLQHQLLVESGANQAAISALLPMTPNAANADKVPVSDLFIQNLAVISEANMSSCLAIATCNEHCWRWPERNASDRRVQLSILERFNAPTGIVLEPVVAAAKGKDDGNGDGDGSDSADAHDFVRIIMNASKRGIDLAKNSIKSMNRTSTCLPCMNEYGECNPMQYQYTTRINAIYRRLTEANATLYDQAPDQNRNLSLEVLYYHYSMQFLDLANLTTCYALVSCENSCSVYKSTIAEESVESVGPPPQVSPFMKDDQYKPKAIDIIHNGALIGYKLALEPTDDCDRCVNHYPDCTPDRYEIARASSNIFG